MLPRLLLTLIALLVAAAPAAAQTATVPTVEEVAQGLRDDGFYVDPAAEAGLSEAEVQQLQAQLQTADLGAVYVAVLPAAAAGQAGQDERDLARQVANAVAQPGIYAFVVGREFVAGAAGSEFSGEEVREIAADAVGANQDGSAAALLTDFVDRLDAAQAERGDVDGSTVALVALGAAGVGGFVWYRRRRRREQERAQLAEVRKVAEEDLTSLGNDLYDLEPHLQVPLPDVPAEAITDYQAATDAYVRARSQLERAQRPADLAAVSETLAEGRYAAASARARLRGEPVPEHRPPCFFDPRHGPSVADVTWAPASGVEREVPACADDVRRIAAGEQPRTREIVVAGQRRAYWDAPSYYGPWAGGYYGWGGGLFEGMLLGSILSGGWGHGWGGHDAGGLGDGGFGDFGGGDFGGFDAGDFGGGDF